MNKSEELENMILAEKILGSYTKVTEDVFGPIFDEMIEEVEKTLKK